MFIATVIIGISTTIIMVSFGRLWECVLGTRSLRKVAGNRGLGFGVQGMICLVTRVWGGEFNKSFRATV